MANTTSPLSPPDRESYHVQDSTSSRSVSPRITTPASEVAPKRLTLKEYTARKQQQAAASEVAPKAKQLTLKEYIARKKQEAAAPQASTIPRNFKPHGLLSPRHGYEPVRMLVPRPLVCVASSFGPFVRIRRHSKTVQQLIDTQNVSSESSIMSACV